MEASKTSQNRKPIVDYSKYINEVAARRKPSLIREMSKWNIEMKQA